MIDTLAKSPAKVVGTALAGLGVSTIEALTIYAQFGIAVSSLLLIWITIYFKIKKRG